MILELSSPWHPAQRCPPSPEVGAEDAAALAKQTWETLAKVGQREEDAVVSEACIPVATGSDGASVMLGKHAGWNERISAERER